MSWIVQENGFDRRRITANGNKFMIGNGYMGYRGTLEEFGRAELTAVTLAGLYDRAGDQWREPVNAPNGMFTQIYCRGELLGLLASEGEPLEHIQELDMLHALHRRRTVYRMPGSADGGRVTVSMERFCSAKRLHLLAGRVSVQCSEDCELLIRTGIDGDVWDINGPHLAGLAGADAEGSLLLTGRTQELQVPVAVAEAWAWASAGETIAGGWRAIEAAVGAAGEMPAEMNELPLPWKTETKVGADFVFREIRLRCKAGETYTFHKFTAVFTGLDEGGDAGEAALKYSREAAALGYEALLKEHAESWERKWERSDVVIHGDGEAQAALRYSLYQLHIISPGHSEKLSIPARGLSGQVYKGAVFWDTEMFMLPFYLHTQPEIARNLLMYRVHTLDGARRKAAEYGYEGAFYAWESQETGDDACTLFNINDVFTGRPMRTYFRDKQVHISADVAYGIWQYYLFTGDGSLLLEGGAEVAWECARFYYSYAYFNPGRQRYEILDVTGPDEYHERVHNNAFTNAMVKKCLSIALEAMAYLQEKQPWQYEALLSGSTVKPEQLREMHDRLYVPHPAADSRLIEQFDRYYMLEDLPLAELQSRMLNPQEYLGGGNGLATTTQILKQADVVLLLHLFSEGYDRDTKRANWEYYEPRTEHGSSLSSCIYALVAADIGIPDWAYPYFMRTATIDLTGDSKQYVGDLYIGGTHPAANGGAWMAAVLGFAGLRFDGGTVRFKPSLPGEWQGVEFPLCLRNQSFRVQVAPSKVTVQAHADNVRGLQFQWGEQIGFAGPGETVSFTCESTSLS
ncbi:glycosyl hydrolase family 65 protein [Paenibacillus sp. FSL W8-0186]|uniref:glycosyl hydrolase family 65 protein n=1 Tax=Paenibacillus sp. FSL W8-0186 TaxID=2921709 RepID=UPI0030CB229C